MNLSRNISDVAFRLSPGRLSPGIPRMHVVLMFLIVPMLLGACMTGEAAAAFNRGNEMMIKEQYGLAIYEYSVAISANPKFTRAYNNRGIAYTERGRYDEAISDFTRVLELDPNYLTAYNNRGIAHYKNGNIVKAVADFEKTIELTDDPALHQQAQKALEEIASKQP